MNRLTTQVSESVESEAVYIMEAENDMSQLTMAALASESTEARADAVYVTESESDRTEANQLSPSAEQPAAQPQTQKSTNHQSTPAAK